MLTALRGRSHDVHSGVSVFDVATNRQLTCVNTTHVSMRAYTDAEIAAYVASGDPFDKAGGYAIQHREFAPVASLDGCISGVIGLPLGDLCDLLREFGVNCPVSAWAVCQPHTEFRCCRVRG